MAAVRLVMLGAFAALGVAFACASVVGCGDDEEESPTEEAPAADADAAASETAKPVFDALPERLLGPAVECAIGSAIEEEKNDTRETATAFTELSICGVLETAQDVDYLTFETPAGTKLAVFQAVIDGKVDFELELAGATFGPSETAKFGPGKYLVKAFTKAGKPASYRIRVQFDPI
jgi:hypothetical protein